MSRTGHCSTWDLPIYVAYPTYAVRLSSNQARCDMDRIRRPDCSECGTRTMLARRMPGRTGFEWQRFDCPKCNHELMREVAYADPQGVSLSGELERSN